MSYTYAFFNALCSAQVFSINLFMNSATIYIHSIYVQDGKNHSIINNKDISYSDDYWKNTFLCLIQLNSLNII